MQMVRQTPPDLPSVSESNRGEWSERSRHWLEQTGQTQTAKSRGRMRLPLILSGHGIRLRLDHGTLLIQDGFTHYPQRRAEHRLFPGDWRLPSRIVIVDGSGSITLDVLRWLAETNISLAQID